MNPVEVNPAELEAELAAAAGAVEAEAQAAQDEVTQAASDPAAWESGARWLVHLIDVKVCPAWALTEHEKTELATTTARVLDHYFPGAFAGFEKWHPALQLGFVVGSIAITRFDLETRRFLPLHPPKEPPRADSAASGRPADGDHRSKPFGENDQRLTPD